MPIRLQRNLQCTQPGNCQPVMQRACPPGIITCPQMRTRACPPGLIGCVETAPTKPTPSANPASNPNPNVPAPSTTVSTVINPPSEPVTTVTVAPSPATAYRLHSILQEVRSLQRNNPVHRARAVALRDEVLRLQRQEAPPAPMQAAPAPMQQAPAPMQSVPVSEEKPGIWAQIFNGILQFLNSPDTGDSTEENLRVAPRNRRAGQNGSQSLY